MESGPKYLDLPCPLSVLSAALWQHEGPVCMIRGRIAHSFIRLLLQDGKTNTDSNSLLVYELELVPRLLELAFKAKAATQKPREA